MAAGQNRTERLSSVDFLRGLTVAAMILVNNPGSWNYIYAPFQHAHWDGCTPTDLIFPFFLFIAGISISISMLKAKESGDRKGIYLKILKRTAILFALGLFLNGFPYFDFSIIRIPGVLQRIALVFCLCSFLYLSCSRKALIIISAFLLLLYWILLCFVPMPGLAHASLEPETNLGAWLDRLVMPGHLWQQSKTWDPESLLGTISAIVTGLAGVLTGQWLLTVREQKDKVIGLFIAGFALIVGGLIWNPFFPINKSLWSSAFVLYTGGIAMVCLAISYYYLDVVKIKKGWTEPFLTFGSNAITAYFVAELTARAIGEIHVGDTDLKTWLYEHLFASWLNPYNASLSMALVWVLLLWLPLRQMYKRNILIKI
ncbi:MAG: acyltransferase family protein [Cytophagaceae bacterium]